ncbi:hypothetical protein GCM10010495_79610 [Kitasatospora herbaricolor]|uniref:hypothetical protein n=1 Tax=Kitasatospora herbaricolor TaxID=68217 RepID=UPI00174A1A0B|nr:hypothetical protein [Kitasatospora herbaricolor]MDQ0305950.1 Flp pilus assembly protein TadB [Kitasatospora herbaricolor]GGV49922.1 hypothetical protein GCM10010495_79610 [Kitasatospora herbaricolor]
MFVVSGDPAVAEGEALCREQFPDLDRTDVRDRWEPEQRERLAELRAGRDAAVLAVRRHPTMVFLVIIVAIVLGIVVIGMLYLLAIGVLLLVAAMVFLAVRSARRRRPLRRPPGTAGPSRPASGKPQRASCPPS